MPRQSFSSFLTTLFSGQFTWEERPCLHFPPYGLLVGPRGREGHSQEDSFFYFIKVTLFIYSCCSHATHAHAQQQKMYAKKEYEEGEGGKKQWWLVGMNQPLIMEPSFFFFFFSSPSIQNPLLSSFEARAKNVQKRGEEEEEAGSSSASSLTSKTERKKEGREDRRLLARSEGDLYTVACLRKNEGKQHHHELFSSRLSGSRHFLSCCAWTEVKIMRYAEQEEKRKAGHVISCFPMIVHGLTWCLKSSGKWSVKAKKGGIPFFDPNFCVV